MGFIISCVIYIAVCEGICNMLDLTEFKEKAWVYAIVGTVGSFLINAMLS
jgi:hypothetical protein